MLSVIVSGTELWDETREEFISSGEDFELMLEHSLISLSKWESKYHKPFLSKKEHSFEETLDYVRCMTLNKYVPDSIYSRLSNENVRTIMEYIQDPMTATTFSKDNKTASGSREIVTSELIYYWMISLNIPFECQKWHLNRLLTLIRVCNIKNTPPKKRSKREIMQRNAELNAQRRQMLNSSG